MVLEDAMIMSDLAVSNK